MNPMTAKPYWTNRAASLYIADARAIPLPDNSVHCVVTSPPYYGLRNYGLQEWKGGDPECDHLTRVKNINGHACLSCDATSEDAGIGNEPTLWEYIDAVVEVFREVWRVLRDDGTCWVNLGDSYANDGKWGGVTGGKHPQGLHGRTGVGRSKVRTGLKPKSLMMAPARIAIALQDDGWVVRQRVIWHKTRNTPEAALDRPVSANEDIYLLAKSCEPTFWTHRDRAGTRSEPEPDYRWTDVTSGKEYQEEPEDYSQEMVECPDCLGEGELEIQSSQPSLFENLMPETMPCSRCNHRDAEQARVHQEVAENQPVEADTTTSTTHFAVRQTPVNSGPSDISQDGRGKKPPSPQEQQDQDRTLPKAPRGLLPNIRRKTGGGRSGRGANLRNVWTIAPQPYRRSPLRQHSPRRYPGSQCVLAGTSEHGVCARCQARPGYPGDFQEIRAPGETSPPREESRAAPGQKPTADGNQLGRNPQGLHPHSRDTGLAPHMRLPGGGDTPGNRPGPLRRLRHHPGRGGEARQKKRRARPQRGVPETGNAANRAVTKVPSEPTYQAGVILRSGRTQVADEEE